MKLRSLNDNHANMGTVILAIATAITISVSIIIIYSVLGGLNITGTDTTLRTAMGESSGFKPSANATNSLLTGLGTFFTLSPIYLVVLIAVAIIGAVMGIMVSRKQ